MQLVAVRAPVGQSLVLRDQRRRFRDFHLLQNVGRILERPQLAAAIRTAVERVADHTVNGLGRELVTQVLLMARLAAPLTLLAILPRRLGRLDQIAGRRLGRSRRVFAGRGQLTLEANDLFAQLLVLPSQCSVFLPQPRVAFQHATKLFLQHGHTPSQPSVFRIASRLLHLHDAGTFTHLTPFDQEQSDRHHEATPITLTTVRLTSSS